MAWCGSAWVLLSFSPDILSSHWVSGLPDLTNNGTVEKKMARVANKSRRPPLLDITKRLSVWSLLDMLARHFLRLLKYCILSQTRISRFLERFHNMMHHLLCIRGKSPTTWATFEAHFDHILTTHCFMPHCSSSTSLPDMILKCKSTWMIEHWGFLWIGKCDG